MVDLEGAYLAPSLIDGHFHVESTMVTMPEFVRAVVPHGTGAMVIDPHEYANVLGLDGIRYVLESSKNLPIDFFIMLPSCVPATPLETAGARFTADDLALMIADDRIAGVAELMNYPGVFLGMESELAKIRAGKGKVDRRTRARIAREKSQRLRARRRAVRSRKHRAGGSAREAAARHAPARAGRQHGTQPRRHHRAGHAAEFRQLLFCHGRQTAGRPGLPKATSIIRSEARSRMGVAPITAIQMGTINTARHYRLRNHGAIAPRFWADFSCSMIWRSLSSNAFTKKENWSRRTAVILAEKPADTAQPRSTMNLRYRAA